MDSIVGFFGKLILTVSIILLMLTVSGSLMQYGEKSDFKQYTNLAIERYGGLTDETLADINAYSVQNFGGRFTIKTKTGKLAYGQVVNYDFEMKITPLFLNVQVFTILDSGSSSSKVR